jgi:fimbrial chaperone protein
MATRHVQMVRWFLLLAGMLASGAVPAQTSLMLWPLDPVIEDNQRAVALWMQNRGSQPVTLQIRVLAWTQDAQGEHFTSTQGVVPSPPMATVPPGQRQLVRLMNTVAPPEGSELAYRVLVDELPPAGVEQDGGAQGSAMGVRMQIRYSIPLFVSGKGHWSRHRVVKQPNAPEGARPDLRWRMHSGANGHELLVRNAGRTAARLTDVQWVGTLPPVTINPGLMGYVLAGAEMRWKLESPPPPGSVLQLRVNNEPAATLEAQ